MGSFHVLHLHLSFWLVGSLHTYKRYNAPSGDWSPAAESWFLWSERSTPSHHGWMQIETFGFWMATSVKIQKKNMDLGGHLMSQPFDHWTDFNPLKTRLILFSIPAVVYATLDFWCDLLWIFNCIHFLCVPICATLFLTTCYGLYFLQHNLQSFFFMWSPLSEETSFLTF